MAKLLKGPVTFVVIALATCWGEVVRMIYVSFFKVFKKGWYVTGMYEMLESSDGYDVVDLQIIQELAISAV